MKDFLLPYGWNEHYREMEKLEDAKGTDFFAVMDYIAPFPYCEQVVIVLHGGSLEEIAGYLRYRVVRDMIWAVQNRPDFELEEVCDEIIAKLTPEQKEKAAEPLHFWRLLGDCFQKENWEKDFIKILKKFNSTFPDLDFCTYEFHVFRGADKLREFLLEKYDGYAEDSAGLLEKVCTTKDFDVEGFVEYCEEAFNYYGG